jgi:hypothetical protein
MRPHEEEIPGVSYDRIFQLLLTGRAKDLYEAEEIYLDESMPELLKLLELPIPDDELAEHPLMRLILAHGSRGRGDSISSPPVASIGAFASILNRRTG